MKQTELLKRAGTPFYDHFYGHSKHEVCGRKEIALIKLGSSYEWPEVGRSLADLDATNRNGV